MTNPDRDDCDDCEELVKLADELDDIEVDADGKCDWTAVATAQTHLRARLRRLASSDSGVKGEPTTYDAMMVAGRLRGLGVKRWREYGELEHKDVLEALRMVWPSAAPPADAGMREAYIAGATAVHNEWVAATERGDGPPRGEPDFSEAASDYAALTALGATTKSDGDDRTAPGQGSLIKRWKSWKHI